MIPGLFTLFLLFVLPLVVIPLGPSFFEVPKVFIAEIVALILSFYFLILKPDQLKKMSRIQLILSGGLVVLSLVHLYLYPNLNLFFGNGFRLQGIFLLWILLIFSLVTSQIKLKVPVWLPLISLITLAVSIPILGSNLSERAVGLLGEPNSLAGVALFFWPFIFLGSKRSLKLVSLVLVCFIIFSSSSRSGLIGLSVQLLFLGLIYLKMAPKRAFLIGLGCLALSLILPFVETNFSQSPFKLEDRAQIWETALQAGFNSPLIGSGFGNIQQTLNTTSQQLNNNIQYQTVDSSHNFLLDYWVQAGILGLVLLVLMMNLSLVNLTKKASTLELTLLLGILAVMLFNPVSVVILVFFWYLIGQGYSLDK